MLRLFIAVELDPEIRGRLAAIHEGLPAWTVRWVRPENLHLTLKFLGEVPQERIPQIREALDRVALQHPPLELVLEGVGAFPDFKRPAVLWVGVSSGQEALRRLARHLERELGGLGFPPGGRDFVGHVTLGRVTPPGRASLPEQAVRDRASGPLGTGRVAEFCLFRSQLRPAGPVYSVLHRFPLAAPEQAVPRAGGAVQESGGAQACRPGGPGIDLGRNLARCTMDKQKALEMAIGQIEKAFGKGSIMKLGEASSRFEVPVIPTGSLAVDVALGIGGVPRGRVSEIYGPESSGKTTLALQVVAEAQKLGGIAAFIDVEHALDPNYAQNLGVNTDELYVAQPDTGEQGLEIVETLVRSNAVDVVVVDSVAAMVPRAEIEGEMGDSHVGLQARLMSQALRKLTAVISKSKTAVIFINQVREKIGVMFGNPETTPGGRALKFYASVRMEVRRIDSLKQGSENVGNRVKVKVVKNKLAPPFKVAEFDILFGKGISREGSLLDVGLEAGVLSKSGTWFSFGDTRLGQGRDNARAWLEENPEAADTIERKVREILGGVTSPPVETKV